MKTLTERIAEARATHDIRDVLSLSSRDRLIVCPLPQHVHKHHTPSFSIFWRRNMQWWRCHGSCDLEGDVVDLVGYLRVPGYDKRNPNLIRQAVELLDQRYQVVIPIPEPEPTLRGGEHRAFLPPGPDVIAYAATRGLTEATLKKFQVGQNEHYMTMPCFEDGILKGIKMRNLWKCAPAKRFWQLEGSRLGLFNHDAVYLKSGLIFIVKGEIPVMLMDQAGFPQTCAPTGGEGSGRAAIQRWTEAVVLAARIVIGDNDGPGRELGQKRSLLFGARLFFPPDRFKDLDEWLLADQEDARRTLNTWRDQTLSNWFD